MTRNHVTQRDMTDPTLQTLWLRPFLHLGFIFRVIAGQLFVRSKHILTQYPGKEWAPGAGSMAQVA